MQQGRQFNKTQEIKYQQKLKNERTANRETEGDKQISIKNLIKHKLCSDTIMHRKSH